MKILRIALIAPQPYFDVRGTCMANLRLIQVFSEIGYAVDVITYPLGSAPEYPGITVHRCRPIPFVRSVKIGFSLAKALLDLNLLMCARRLIRRNKYDCIHGVEEGAFIGGLLGRLTGTPFIYDMDSVMSHEIENSPVGKFPFAARLVRAVEHWAIRKSALVVTISDSMVDYVRKVDPSKAAVVVPDVPIPFPSGGPDITRARAQLPSQLLDKKILLYAGSFANYQGLDLLISAMPKVTANNPKAALVIIGGDDKSIKRLSGTAKNIHFTGKKPPEQIPDFLAAADVLMSPRRGGINPPAKIYTYMQSGKPIVATDIPAHTTVLDRNSATLVEPKPDGIADGILHILAHPEEANQKAIRAQGIVGKITPELQALRIREAYEILTARTKHA